MHLRVDHLKQVNSDFKVHLCDRLDMDIPVWIVDQCVVNAADVDVILKEPLSELRSDIKSPSKFGVVFFRFIFNKKNILGKLCGF